MTTVEKLEHLHALINFVLTPYAYHDQRWELRSHQDQDGDIFGFRFVGASVDQVVASAYESIVVKGEPHDEYLPAGAVTKAGDAA